MPHPRPLIAAGLRYAVVATVLAAAPMGARAELPSPPKVIDVLTVPTFATEPPPDWKVPDLIPALGRPGWTVLESSLTPVAYVGHEGAVVGAVRCKGAPHADRGFDTCQVVLAHLVMAAPLAAGGTAELSKMRTTFAMTGGTSVLPPDDVYHLEPLVLADVNGDQLPEILVRWSVTGKPRRAVGSPLLTTMVIVNWLDHTTAWGPFKIGAMGAGELERCISTVQSITYDPAEADPAPTLAWHRVCQPAICVDAPELAPTCKTTKPRVTDAHYAWNAGRSLYQKGPPPVRAQDARPQPRP